MQSERVTAKEIGNEEDNSSAREIGLRGSMINFFHSLGRAKKRRSRKSVGQKKNVKLYLR